MQILKAKAFAKQEILVGDKVVKYQKKLSDIQDIYLNSTACSNQLMYEVYLYDERKSNLIGDLAVGLTVLYPVLVNQECNMTRGHFHLNRNCSEIYYGISGTGLLMLMDAERNTWFEQVSPGSIHYIKGDLAHRLINTSNEILKVQACWAPAAGHDYLAVEQLSFGYRVFRKNGKVVFKKC